MSYKQRKRQQEPKVKLGHGGTLDPLATGVLIVGVGSGTKALNQFLACTKTYETVVLFGAATDSYDVTGKVVAKAPFAHLTRTKVEEALAQFKGKIRQRPPIFSALKVKGKPLYEYALCILKMRIPQTALLPAFLRVPTLPLIGSGSERLLLTTLLHYQPRF